mgnify:CR=1 FL=1
MSRCEHCQGEDHDSLAHHRWDLAMDVARLCLFLGDEAGARMWLRLAAALERKEAR